jgi:hypothetical protein
MEPCCEALLTKIAEVYHIPLDELHQVATGKHNKCSWVYQKKTKEKEVGDRCGVPAKQGMVFCTKHHHAAGAQTNGITLGSSIVTNSYDPSIGLLKLSFSKAEQKIELIKGSLEEFDAQIASGILMQRLKDKHHVRS